MSDDSKKSDEPKIIVDDDWKSQVEQEKEELKRKAEVDSDSASAETPGQQELPPATFMILMSTLATQAMATMGILPDPVTGTPTTNLPMAKHFIDLLAMLQEKTKGNLTEDESAHLRDALHQLRMVFVSSSKPQASQDDGSPKSSTIELP